MNDFEGTVALVSGGASGIGAATAALLSARGAKVAVFDLDPSGAPVGTLGIAGDVSDSGVVDAAVAQTEAELGPLNAVICCAGTGGSRCTPST